MCSWASSRRWGRSLVGLDEGFDLLHLSIHLGVVGVVRGIELVVVVVVDRGWNTLPIHRKTRVEVSRKWDKQYQVTFSQSWGCIPFHSMWDERIVELVPDLFTPTYKLKLMELLGEDSGTKIWCKMLARVNNVERDSQIRKQKKWTNSKEWHTETHTRIDNWGRATKEQAQNVESTENALVAQHWRHASSIAQ